MRASRLLLRGAARSPRRSSGGWRPPGRARACRRSPPRRAQCTVPPVRVAVVTGGSSGIGAALGQALTKRGWRCVLVARNQERLERTAAEIGAEAEICDVGDRGLVEELASRVGKRHPAVHLLVNNAGTAGRRGFLELEPERI